MFTPTTFTAEEMKFQGLTLADVAEMNERLEREYDEQVAADAHLALFDATAEAIRDALIAAGWSCRKIGYSNQSLSVYVEATHETEDDAISFKVRVSDHDLPSHYSAADHDVHVGDACRGEAHNWIASSDDIPAVVAEVLAAAERAGE